MSSMKEPSGGQIERPSRAANFESRLKAYAANMHSCVAGTDQGEAHQYSSDRWLICIHLSWNDVISGLLPGTAPCLLLPKCNAACSEAPSDISLTDNEDAGSEEVCCTGRAVGAVPGCLLCRMAADISQARLAQSIAWWLLDWQTSGSAVSPLLCLVTFQAYKQQECRHTWQQATLAAERML